VTPSSERWWGWGDPAAATEVPAAADELLGQELELPAGWSGAPAAALDDVRVPEPRLGGDVAARLSSVVGEAGLIIDHDARVRHAGGKSYPDLVRLRAGDAESAPDAIVLPGSHDEVAEVLATCSEAGIAVVPYGGGTSVVGGVEPIRERFEAAISLDMRRMDGVLDADPRSLTATLSPGLTGPAAEAALGGRGMTLGHFPQSFEYATVGGFVATRSAGQASTGYGRIDELVRGLRCATPAGDLVARPVPATAAGPDIRELLVGSEGVLGVITEVTLSVRRAPSARRYEGWSFRSFDEGTEAFRLMEQRGAAPDVARLSDESETRLTLALAAAGSADGRGAAAKRRAGEGYLRARGHEGGCIAILGWEGERREVGRRRSASARLARRGGGIPLGQGPGRAWARGRYAGPYLRDALLDRGIMAETLETAATWSRHGELYEAVGSALRESLSERGTRPLVMCHVSHLYPSGASLYFTFLARQERGVELEQWRAAKTAATDAIVGAGGTITHHHAVGRDHAPWMRAEVGDVGVEVLRAAKERLDQRGIMNPGKLLPPREAV
jgi:alkyldihydroxyacetonephosphate synthase